jgi:hypothetical protein
VLTWRSTKLRNVLVNFFFGRVMSVQQFLSNAT